VGLGVGMEVIKDRGRADIIKRTGILLMSSMLEYYR
jgi:hypothetical protein